LDGAQEARAAGMQDPTLDVFAFCFVAVKKTVDEFLDAFPDHFRNVFGDDDGGRAVAKENRGDQVRLGNVLALKGEGGEFDGDNQDVAAWIGSDKIGGTRKAHGARGASQFGEGHAAHVGAETHQLDQVGVKRGDHETRAGNGDNQINVFGTHAGALEAFFGSFAAKLDGVLDVFIIGLGQRPGFDGVIDGEN